MVKGRVEVVEVATLKHKVKWTLELELTKGSLEHVELLKDYFFNIFVYV